eukprot:7129352-Pyramimonas_sp.AAC.1
MAVTRRPWCVCRYVYEMFVKIKVLSVADSARVEPLLFWLEVGRSGSGRAADRDIVMTWRKQEARLAKHVRHHGQTFALTIMECKLR